MKKKKFVIKTEAIIDDSKQFITFIFLIVLKRILFNTNLRSICLMFYKENLFQLL